jgi:pre-mRNA-splicing factor ATP-dependent RNA helicase DHX15/PRP43
MCIVWTWSFSNSLTASQDGDVNPFTKQPLSVGYKKILEARKKLPVFAQMKEFYEMVSTPYFNRHV